MNDDNHIWQVTYPDPPLAFHTLQDAHAKWAGYNFPCATPVQALLGVVEEVGELSHAVLKREQGIRGSTDSHDEAIEDAVGDIVLYLAHFCTLSHIDMNDAVTKTWREVNERDWVQWPERGIPDE